MGIYPGQDIDAASKEIEACILESARQDPWVARDCRDAGLGTRMLRQVVVHGASQWQAGYLDLMVHGHNSHADQFYPRHGFIERSHDRHLTLDGTAFEVLDDGAVLPGTSDGIFLP